MLSAELISPYKECRMNQKLMNHCLAKSAKVVKALGEEMEKASHSALKFLLNKEIDAHLSLLASFQNLLHTLEAYRTIAHNATPKPDIFIHQMNQQILDSILSGSIANLESTLEAIKAIHSQLETLNALDRHTNDLTELAASAFLDALEREPDKLLHFLQKLTHIIGCCCVSFSTGPVFSSFIEILSTLIDAVDAIIAYSSPVPSYKDTDKQLLLIENHTKILETTSLLFDLVEKEIAAALPANESGGEA